MVTNDRFRQDMMGSDATIVIGGAGPAGSACAIRLAQCGHEVILLDKCAFPRRKLCGGFLGPDALSCLHALGVLDAVRTYAHGPIEKIRLYNVKGEPLLVETRWLRSDFPYAFAIPRQILDALLVHHARQLSVQVLERREVLSCYALADVQDGVFRVETTCRENSHAGSGAILTRCFVDASGRNSRLSAFQPFASRSAERDSETPEAKKNEVHHDELKEINQDKLTQKVGLQCHVTMMRPNANPDLHMFLFPGGYGGYQPVSDQRANVCLWVRPNLAKVRQQGFPALMDVTLSQNPAARLLLDSAEQVEPDETIAAVSGIDRRPSRHRSLSPFLRIGDRLNTVEPFSGFGMAHALKTGCLAAECIHDGLRNGASYAQIQKRYHQVYRHRFGFHLQSMRGLHPLLESGWVQRNLWHCIPPFLPLLASLYR